MMSYAVNWKIINFPAWFYPKLHELEKEWALKNAQWCQNIYTYPEKKRKEEFKFLSQTCMEEVGRKAWPIYIYTIDTYENKGWPQKIIKSSKSDVRGLCLIRLADTILLLYDQNDFTDPTHHLNCVLNISEKLREALILDGCYQHTYDYNLYKLEKLKIINGPLQAKYYEQMVFDGFSRNNPCLIKHACNWLKKGWISPIKYEAEIYQFVSQPIRGQYHSGEILTPIVLQAIHEYSSVYSKAATLYDKEVRRFNLEGFETYRRDEDNNPSDFKALPFADGSCMKPVRSWFSWKLK